MIDSKNFNGALSAAKAEMNDWLRRNPVDVINIETCFATSGGGMGFSGDVKLREVGLRVWFRLTPQAD